MTKKAEEVSVLYDVPGPRSRRWSLIASLCATALLILLGYLLIYRPLDDAGQFSMQLWGPLVDPGHEYFDQVWRRLWVGAQATLKAAGLAIVASLFFGTLLALLRVQLKALLTRRFSTLPPVLRITIVSVSWVLNGVTRFCVEVFRGLPVIITIFFASRLGPEFGFSVKNPMWYVVIGLTLYNMVVIAEILRSGMEGLPTGQREAASSLGLSSFQTTRMILLPQSFKVMLPALISQIIVILKDTSLGTLIAYHELLNIGKQIIGVTHNPVQVYTIIAAMYIAINYSLSKVAQYAQYRFARR